MNILRASLLAAAVALAFAAQAQTASTKIEQRFSSFAGSEVNSASLVTGLRTGGEITLTGAGETATFTSPAKPMGYGNVTRALDLAQRELAAGGITDPTPKELQAALMGGMETAACLGDDFDDPLHGQTMARLLDQVVESLSLQERHDEERLPVPFVVELADVEDLDDVRMADRLERGGLLVEELQRERIGEFV